MNRQLIVCRTQMGWMGLSILCLIDKALGMLNAHAHGKGLADHGKAVLVQSLKGIPSTVPDGQDHMIRFKGPGLSRRFIFNGTDMPVFPDESCHPGLKADLAAQGTDVFPDSDDAVGQLVRSDMRFGIIGDLRGCTVLDQGMQNRENPRILDSAVQLSVRKGPRTALAELDIGNRGESGGTL